MFPLVNETKEVTIYTNKRFIMEYNSSNIIQFIPPITYPAAE